MKNKIKIAFIISISIVILNISTIVFAENTITKIIRANESIDNSTFMQEIEENGKKYNFCGYEELTTIPETKSQSYISDEKMLSSNEKEYLDTQFDSTYMYEDENYKGQLELKSYNIQEIDNGYSEQIDSKYIYYNSLSSNDLEQIDKTRTIQGKEYVLINVEWSANSSSIIDKTEVPISYNGKALYQCVIKIANSPIYKAQAIYEGNVVSKENYSDYVLTYTEIENEEPIDEDTKNYIIPVTIALGGIILICICGILLDKNATVYNVQEGKMVKLKSKRIRANSVINITDCENISGNCFILAVKETSYQKLSGKTVYIQFNNQRKEIILTTRKTCFKF